VLSTVVLISILSTESLTKTERPGFGRAFFLPGVAWDGLRVELFPIILYPPNFNRMRNLLHGTDWPPIHSAIRSGREFLGRVVAVGLQ